MKNHEHHVDLGVTQHVDISGFKIYWSSNCWILLSVLLFIVDKTKYVGDCQANSKQRTGKFPEYTSYIHIYIDMCIFKVYIYIYE